SQSGPRGDDQVNGIGWYMLMGSRPLGKGELMLRTMLSPEPLTVGKHGYPLLFQSGEAVNGRPLVDFQHPHDLFMELAARYRREPDENRWDIDPIRFNSFSGRLSFNPCPSWSLQASYGYVKSPESLRPDDDIRRTTVSATYNRSMQGGGKWATTFVWGRNRTH